MEKYNRRKWLADTTLLSAAILFGPMPGKASVLVRDFGLIKLSGNENPYGPSPVALNAIKKHILSANRYPFDHARALAVKIAERLGLEDASYVLMGAGSSGLLELLGSWAIYENLHLTCAFPAFPILPDYVKRCGGKVTKTLLTPELKHDLKALQQASEQHPGLVYVVNPNNPTGTKLGKNALLDFCRNVTRHSYVVVDEAYIEYAGAGASVVELVHENPKVIVLRTFSKIYGLAGLRVGYALAHPDTLKALKKLQCWENSSMNLPGIVAASASLDDAGFVEESRAKNQACIDFTVNALKKLGLQTAKSHTNFLYFEPEGYPGNFREAMKKHNILVSNLTIDNKEKIRVSMGTGTEMETFVKVIRQILK